MIETLRPNAPGSQTAIPYQYPLPGHHWDKVDEAIPDEDSTYLSVRYQTLRRDLYHLPPHTQEAGFINSITIYFRIRTTHGTYSALCKPSQQSGGVVTDGSTQSTNSTSYVTKSQTYTLNPATGLAYTWDEIDALQIGIVLLTNTLQDFVYARCTQVYVEVDYAPPGPTIETQDATNIKSNQATLHTKVIDDKGETLSVHHNYGKTTAYGMNTPWQEGKHTDDVISQTVTNLDPETEYHFRGEAIYQD